MRRVARQRGTPRWATLFYVLEWAEIFGFPCAIHLMLMYFF